MEVEISRTKTDCDGGVAITTGGSRFRRAVLSPASDQDTFVVGYAGRRAETKAAGPDRTDLAFSGHWTAGKGVVADERAAAHV